LILAFSAPVAYNGQKRTAKRADGRSGSFRHNTGGEPMENEELCPEEEVSTLTLTDEDGQDVTFEYLDCLDYQGKEYLVLMPQEESSGQIVILEVEPVDAENENYLAVEEEAVLDAVYGLFKEKYKDVLTFED